MVTNSLLLGLAALNAGAYLQDARLLTCIGDNGVFVAANSRGGCKVTEHAFTKSGRLTRGDSIAIRGSVLSLCPGDRDTALLLVRRNGPRLEVLRLSQRATSLVASFSADPAFGEPEYQLARSRDLLVLQSLRGGEEPNLRIWLKSAKWSGPFVADQWELRKPLNQKEVTRTDRFPEYGASGRTGYVWRIERFNATEQKLLATYYVRADQFKAIDKSVDGLNVIPTAVGDQLALVGSGANGSFLALIRGDKISIYVTDQKDTVAMDQPWNDRLFVDAGGGFWMSLNSGEVVRIHPRLISTQYIHRDL